VVALVHVLIFLSFGAFESVCPSRDESVESTVQVADQKVWRAISGSTPVCNLFS
jgi:hypothetical protein